MSNYGLVRVIPGSDIPADIPADEIDAVVESQLTSHIRKHWEINRNAKIRIEQDLLEDLRARRGEYHPSKLTQIRNQGGSEIYMMITATKQRAAASWIKDIALPEDDKSWGIDPTPIPELPEWAEQAAQKRVAEMGGGIDDYMALAQVLGLELSNQAQISSDNMERKISDQLVESGWGETINALIDDFTTFSACILKGPQLKKRKTLKWKSGFGTMTPQVSEQLRPEFTRVSPFDCYPSPEASSPNEGHFIEHIRFERGELYNMLGVPGYKDEQIREVLENYSTGLKEWLWQDTERNENERHHHWWRGETGLIDGLHYWGSVQGKKLSEWGIKVPDLLAEYQIDAILIGRFIIRCEINNDPLARRPYHKACYDPIPGAFWGNSIRYLMNDIQEFCNATARALVNNMAMASGPMVEINYERLSPLENELEIYPWKIWQTRGSEVGGGAAVQFFQPESNASELMSVYEQFEKRADDATSIPRYSHGNEKVGGAGTTASGLSMLMNSAAKGIKAAIGNLDFGVTRPAIEQMYYYNMMTTKDPSILGDSKVIARGANALLLKDMAQQRRNEFLSLTANEFDMSIIGKDGRADILRGVAKDFDMDGVVPSREVIRQRMEDEAKNPPPNPEMVKADNARQLEQIKQDGEAQRLEIMEQFKKDAQEIELQKVSEDKTVKLALIEAKVRADLDKQQRDEAMKIRLMDEETIRIRERAEINAETDLEKHALEMEAKEADTENRKAEVAALPKPVEPAAKESRPLELTVVIDNTSGTIKKKITVNRNKDREVETLDVEQKEV